MFEPPPHHDHRAAGQILDCLAVETEMKRFIWDILIVQQEVEMITGLIIHLADSLLFSSSFFLCIMCECEKSNIKALFTCVCVCSCVCISAASQRSTHRRFCIYLYITLKVCCVHVDVCVTLLCGGGQITVTDCAFIFQLQKPL